MLFRSLDEPTNDLDIDTLELLEDLLADYPGTALVVSHDRAFLDNVVTQTLAAEGDGRWKEYAGGYADWLRQRPAARAPAAATRTPAERPATIEPRTKPATGKLSYKEQRELEQLPQAIEALEAEQRALAAAMAGAEYHKRGADALRRDATRAVEIEQQLESAFERWAELDMKRNAAR